MNTLKISVVIPAFNQVDYLKLAIESVLNQTHSNLELIVVDDGSVDQTRNMVLNFASKDGRIKYIYQSNDGTFGLGARNWGMINATGDWIALLDQDDVWYPEKLSQQINLASSNENVGCVFSPVNFINYKGDLIGVQTDANQAEYTFPELLKKNKIYVSSGIFERKLLAKTGLPNESSGYADWWLWLSMSKHTRVLKTSQVLAAYRIQDDSFQQQQLKKDLYKFAQDNLLVTLSQFNRIFLNKKWKEDYQDSLNERVKLYLRAGYKDLASFNVSSFLNNAYFIFIFASGFKSKLKFLIKIFFESPLRAIILRLRG